MRTTGELGLRVQFASWVGFKGTLSGRQMEVSIMNARNLMKMLAAVLIAGMVASPMVLAKGPLGGGGGGGGRPGEETAAQSLSVPTILVGPLGAIQCGVSDLAPSVLMPPTGIPQAGYEVPGYYWVQKMHAWQAQCFRADEASVFGAWGDNLEGDAKLVVGSPIRVELVLINMTDYSATIPNGTLQGYNVIKLQPNLLDRLSAYGHLAGGDEVGGWTDIPTNFGQGSWLVHDQGITFSVLNTDTGVYAVPLGTNPTAEINATGKVVYGYNLRVSEAGNYRIQFTSTPTVTFTGQDAANGGMDDANNVWIDIEVLSGGGGGGGGGNGNGLGR